MLNNLQDTQAELLRRLKAVKLPVGGGWFHNQRAVSKPINSNDDVAVMSGSDCFAVHHGTATVKVDNLDGSVYFTDRIGASDADRLAFINSCLRHIPR